MRKVTLELTGKLTGMSYHVLTSNMLIMDLTCCLEKPTKYDDIKKMVKWALESSVQEPLHYTEDQAVSSNFNSDTHFSAFDAGALTLAITLLRPFPGMTTNLAIVSEWWHSL